MRKIVSAVLVFAFGVLLHMSARAEGNSCTDWSPSDAFNYSSVTGKTFFYKDDRDTKQKAFLVKGDVVAVRNIKTDFACAVYIGKTGIATIGWLEVKDLKDARLTQKAEGKWKRIGGQTNIGIIISKSKIEGLANLNQSNERYFSAPLKLEDNLWVARDSACNMAVLYLNTYLMFRYSGSCSNIKTNFSGVYKRT
jgi:hypothetical protein